MPAMAAAGARSRFGSRISSPIVEASSTPTRALHITAKLVAASQETPVIAGTSAWTPAAIAAAAAASTSTTLARLLIPPTLWIHLPTAAPRTLATVMNTSQPKASAATNGFEAASVSARPSPAAKANTPAM